MPLLSGAVSSEARAHCRARGCLHEAGLAQRLTDALLEAGLYTRVAMDVICLAPPLVTDDDTIDRIVEILRVTIPRVVRG